MYKNKKIIGVIPARAKSKRLPDKNILNFCGKPLIAHTIETAGRSKYIDNLIVTTDSPDIAMISEKYGASAPFIRPKKLASDNAKTVDVICHALKWLDRRGERYDVVVVLQPTSPLRKAGDIDKSIMALFAKKAMTIVSVSMTDHNPCWSNTLPRDGCMKTFLRPGILNKNSQNLPVFYTLNGAIYTGYCDYIVKQKRLVGHKTYAYVMPKERSVDIDDEMDFNFAQFLYNERSR